jgi:hypothetical protein
MAGLLWGLVVLLVILWALGFFAAYLGSLIHILLVLAMLKILPVLPIQSTLPTLPMLSTLPVPRNAVPQA